MTVKGVGLLLPDVIMISVQVKDLKTRGYRDVCREIWVKTIAISVWYEKMTGIAELPGGYIGGYVTMDYYKRISYLLLLKSQWKNEISHS